MSEVIQIKAEKRDLTGTGASRAARREKVIPSVIYAGEKSEILHVNVDRAVIDREVKKKGFFTHIFEIELDGKKLRVMPKDIQLHPVTDAPMHLDFYPVGKDTKISVNIPLVFEGQEECPGLKKGGVLNVIRSEIDVQCIAGNIPSTITVNLGDLDLGDSLHFNGLVLPEGVKDIHNQDDLTILVLLAPRVEKEESEDVAAEGEEGEEGAEGTEEGAEEGAAE
ncbi:MAG: 50S ribosomal protein L25/general stress protein Ctc [Alphaproteobacteria bacterium]